MVLDIVSNDANAENVSKSVSDNEKVNKTTLDRDESKREYLHFFMKKSNYRYRVNGMLRNFA